ncbi:TatD family hydrolase [Carboxylicivirga linearis]|uniref:TatD family hydrolase n=1 Tax=Carboxylicivirga linearis TaxID=1628157 RepID=A0ABS5JSG4_9BACT|nr:TatD family hydrolase [Carboxylicivirga linearis]
MIFLNKQVLIDTHSHIYTEEFDEDRSAVVKNALDSGVRKILLPNVDASSIERLHQTEKEFPDVCIAMMGVHPTSVKEDYQAELDIVKQWLDNRPYIAVGEIGIDLYWDKAFRKEQMEVFEQQIIWAKEKDLPIVIHCREAFPEVFEVVEKQLDDKLRGVFHSFTGSADDAIRIEEYGSFLMGINGVVTFKNTHLREALKDVSINKLVLETDAPYLAPVPYRGKRNEPSYIQKVAGTLSEVYEKPIDYIIAQTSENASRLFTI